MKKLIYIFAISVLLVAGYAIVTRFNLNPSKQVGQILDEFEKVPVYYNGGVNNSVGRNVSADGYNIGLKYQCVEFVKRFYYQRFNHKMPDAYGHAKDFFDKTIPDGQLNKKRGLLQFSNGSTLAPQTEDLIVFDGWLFNPYGHVAIITRVGNDSLELIQQNPGLWGSSRENFGVQYKNGKWFVENNRVLGWLRIANPKPN